PITPILNRQIEPPITLTMSITVNWISTAVENAVRQSNPNWPATFERFAVRATQPDFNPKKYVFTSATIRQGERSSSHLYVLVATDKSLKLTGATFTQPRIPAQGEESVVDVEEEEKEVDDDAE
ncbi:hypothetical protein H0H93_009887, partial [Arthromyces matolae]